jgi:Na+/H+ antiporter NhaC
MGGVDAVVNLGINTIDVAYFRFFLDRFLFIYCYGNISWTIVAIGPIVVCLQIKRSLLPLISGALLGGSMLGIFIDDFRYDDCATQSLGCDLKDKFKINLFIAFPAALLTILVFFYLD